MQGSYTATQIVGTKALLHGISRAAMAKAQGYKTSSAFWSGFAASAMGGLRSKVSGNSYEANVAFSAVSSGTVSTITGGKFANGAVTGAFIYMYNHSGHTKNTSWDTNGNGKLSLSEARNWGNTGKGADIDVDASKLTVLITDDRHIVMGGDYFSHGQVWVNDDGTIQSGRYNFDMKPYDSISNTLRNIGTIGGAVVNYGIKTYEIHYYNKPKLIRFSE